MVQTIQTTPKINNNMMNNENQIDTAKFDDGLAFDEDSNELKSDSVNTIAVIEESSDEKS